MAALSIISTVCRENVQTHPHERWHTDAVSMETVPKMWYVRKDNYKGVEWPDIVVRQIAALEILVYLTLWVYRHKTHGR